MIWLRPCERKKERKKSTDKLTLEWCAASQTAVVAGSKLWNDY